MQEDDLRGLAKIMAFMRAVAVLLVLMNFYWYCYSFFLQQGWTLEIIDNILHNFQRTSGLFTNSLYSKMFSLILLALSCLGTKGVKNEKITWKNIRIYLLSGSVSYLLNFPLIQISPVLYMITSSVGFM
ncbi:MAG: conjugal transfer protein TraG, partial [Flavobacterium psychrophilum]